MRISDIIFRVIGAREDKCPDDADVLAYSEGKLSTRPRLRIEQHFAACNDCRQILVSLARESAETQGQLNEEALSEQTNRILAYIKRDERSKRGKRGQPAAGYYVSYPRLATVGLFICAIAAGTIFIVTRDHSPANAMAALRLGLRDARYTQARISGGLEYSPYSGTTRGGDSKNDDLHLDRAENKVKAAAQDPAAVDARLVLARIHLAHGTPRGATQALAILNQLAANGVETAEVLNDTGVAHFQLTDYLEAIADFNKALTKSPAYNEALFNRALAEGMTLHNDQDARRDWQTFLDKSSDEKWKNEARERLKQLNEPIR